MDIVTSSYIPGDPRLIDQIVYELKSQGIFDQFRKECIADVDTKPAYQNLSQRVEGSVMNFLKKQTFSEDMNKNQLREQLRKNISESGFLETGVERIVNQVVNPKINTVFLPKVEEVVYRFLGIQKPNQEAKEEEKPNVETLLPNDLEAVSPESEHDNSFNLNAEKKDESIETNSLNSSNTKTEDESPPFELLEENTKFSMHEENSIDSHLSGISGLASHESNHATEIKETIPMDISQDNSHISLNSEGNLSIVTSEEDTKMEICEDSNLSEHRKENNICKNNDDIIENKTQEKEMHVDETDDKDKLSEKNEERTEEIKRINEMKFEDKKDVEVKKSEEKKSNEKKSHDKHKSSRSDKDRKDDKDKKSRSKSRDHKDSKSSSKYSSSSKDKERDKDKKDYRNGRDKDEGLEKDKQVKKEDKEREKSKDKSNKSKEKEKSEKDKDRPDKDKDKLTRDKDKSDKDKSSKDKSVKDRSDKDRDKEKLDREKSKSEKEKSKSDKDKEKIDKDKAEKEKSSSSKHSKEKSSSSSKKEYPTKDKEKSDEKLLKDKSSSSKDKTSASGKNKQSSSKDKDSSKSSKDKDRSKSGSSSSKDKDKERKGSGDSKSKSSDKHKKSDKSKSSHHDKNSSSAKKDKDKKVIDDHYSLKDKKSERRSTDRDSNDGSSKMSRNGSVTDTYAQSFKGSSKGSSEVFSSGSGDSSNSDKMDDVPTEKEIHVNGIDVFQIEVPQTIKYIKPKFASNIHEAMKIMKIRKQLAKLERQNQLSLANVQVMKDSQEESKVESNLKEFSIMLEKSSDKYALSNNKLDNMNNKENIKSTVENNSHTEEPTILSDEPQIKIKELESSNKIDLKNRSENEAIKNETQNLPEQIVDESPMLKSQDLSMETFEALEARLAQEMSNINCHMYGEEDDADDYASITFSPVKKRKFSEERKPCLKKILFNTSNENADDDEDKEVELIVNKQVEISTKETNATERDINIPMNVSQMQIEIISEEIVVVDQPEVPNVFIDENSKVIPEEEELVICELHEECVDYSQETIISDVNIDEKNEDLRQSAECIKETIREENYDVDMEGVELINDHENEKKKTDITCNDDSLEFRGFSNAEKDNTKVINFTKKICEEQNIFDKFNNIKNNITSVTTPEEDIINPPMKEGRIILKRGLSLEATIKEVRNMSSAIQDLLQKNGKKLFIKVDKLEYEIPSKVLVNFQEVETNGNINNQQINHESIKNGQETQDKFKERFITEEKVCKGEETRIYQISKELSNSSELKLSPKLNNNGLIEQKDLRPNNMEWEDDESPCYYFDNSDSKNEKRLTILNEMIARLEKAVEKQSLQIQNNIPSVKKRGRKRRAPSTENNNGLSAQSKPEPKRRLLNDGLLKQNADSLCNTSFTFILDVSSNQSFSLPLSPADSDKSDEHKKDEPITVRTKRTGRVSNSKRYSSEDLYKPRPVLGCSSSRRRGAKSEEQKL